MQNEVFVTLVHAILIFPALFLLGSIAARALKESDSKMAGVVYVALGLGIFSYYLVAVGHMNFLTRPAIFAFLGLVYLVRWKALRSFLGWLGDLWGCFTGEKNNAYRLGAAAFVFMAALTFVLCFVPETANDALCYQLNIPQAFARHHSTRPIFYDFNSYMPFLLQHAFAASLVLGSAALAKLFHWLTGILLFFAMFLCVFRLTRRKMLALFCAFMFWLTPTCINEVSSTYVDVAVAFFFLLMMWLFWEGFESRKTPLFFLGGLFLGFIVSIKMIAVLWGGAFVFLSAAVAWGRFKRADFVKMLLAVCVGALLGCGFWFVRNWCLEHNPVFPYMENVFGGPSLGLMRSYTDVGSPKTLGNFLLLPWNLAFDPAFFEGYWVGPFYFFMVPFALWGAFKDRKALFCLACFGVSAVLWFFVGRNVRFLLPFLPAYLIAAAIGISSLRSFSPWTERLLRLAGGGVIVFLIALGLWHYRYPLRVLTGQWSPEQYLEKVERTYSAGKWVSQNLPADARILNAEEVRQFYFDRDMVRDVWFRSRTNYDKLIDSRDLLNYFRSKGFTHVLRADSLGHNGAMLVDPQYRSLDILLSDLKKASLLKQIDSNNIRENRCSYRIYKILGER